jgi:hypothetical protein
VQVVDEKLFETCQHVNVRSKEHFVRRSGGDSVRLSTYSKIFLPELYSL